MTILFILYKGAVALAAVCGEIMYIPKHHSCADAHQALVFVTLLLKEKKDTKSRKKDPEWNKVYYCQFEYTFVFVKF